MTTLTNSFFKITEFCKWYNTQAGIKRSDKRAIETLGNLEDFKNLLTAKCQEWGFKELSCEISTGAGRFPKVPWVCLLPKNERISNGVYIATCFAKDGLGVVSGLAKSKSNEQSLEVITRTSKTQGQSLQDPWTIDVDGINKSTKYNNTFTNPQEFHTDDTFNETTYLAHIKKSIELYYQYSLIAKPSIQEISNTTYTPNNFIKFQEQSTSLLYSALAKPFTILTGASGTGKTKIAESLAKYYSNVNGDNSVVVAVGADWSDNRSTLGFVNHLREENDNPVYQSTEILNLLLRANKEKNQHFPYFLILDEMNLSHVERYFADFLSVMEQKEGFFHLHDEARDLKNCSAQEPDVPARLAYPKNFFVIGTVNIDETTYMFSPKVLDRANVIEFKVDHNEIKKFLNDPSEYKEIDQAETGQAEAFLEVSKKARNSNLTELSKEISQPLNQHLLLLFDIMQAGRFEFAYRTANEIIRYMNVAQELTAKDEANTWKESGWHINFDEQIVQKILPKLHGSISRIGNLIAQLAYFCHTEETKESVSLSEIIGGLEGSPRYPKSYNKLRSMAKTLNDEQFVSFIH